MKRRLIIGLITVMALFVMGTLLFAVGVLSTPRDYSSPTVTIRILDRDGKPLKDLDVSRSWHDADCGTEGSESAKADQSGVFRFPKVPAKVGLFTGAVHKALYCFASCGAGSGTSTEIWVRFRGLCDVTPFGKSLHLVGQSHQDEAGVWFCQSTDSFSNTTVDLTFPGTMTNIDYVLSSTVASEKNGE